MPSAYRILGAKRAGRSLSEEEIRAVVRGATDGSWSDGQLGAFLMAAAIRGLDPRETRTLTVAMLESGERWELAIEVGGLADKHSTGGVGDKVSLVLAPLLAACGVPVAMLTGRGLGHTGGTADKLEAIPGIDLRLDRGLAIRLLRETGMAIGIATGAVAPADRRFYALRDATATVDSLPLITASILSKKLATGAAAIAFDVKVGNGAFLRGVEEARALAGSLVETCGALGMAASAVLTDMSQPLGDWVGHAAEVREALSCLAGEGPGEIMEVAYTLGEELAELLGGKLDRQRLEAAVRSGAARERFAAWAAAQGADPAWLRSPELALAPEERAIRAPRSGVLARVATRRLGLLMVEAGAGRRRPGDEIDHGVALHYPCRLGQRLEAGEEMARLYLRRPEEALEDRFRDCFIIADQGEAPRLIVEGVKAGDRP